MLIAGNSRYTLCTVFFKTFCRFGIFQNKNWGDLSYVVGGKVYASVGVWL